MPTISVVRIYADGSGDFTSLKAGWDANKTNLVTADVALEFELKGNLINTDAFVDATGYTTDATRNITVRPIAGDETTSVAGASGTVYGTNTFILVCRSQFITFKCLEVDGFSNIFHTAANLKVQDCLIHDGSVVVQTAGAQVTNTIAYDCAINTIDNVDCDQVTIVSKDLTVSVLYRNAGGVLTRNVAHTTNTGSNSFFATTNVGNDENASEDGSAPGSTTFSVSTSDFVDYANDDFDIDSGSSLFTAGSGGTRIGALLTVSSGISITVDSGSFLLSGTSTPLKSSFNTQPLTGSYSLIGTSANLKSDLSIVTTSGSYTLSGTVANLLVARKLLTEVGSYTLTGTDVTLIYTPVAPGDTLIINSGTFSLSGTETILSADLRIASDAGSYTKTGTSAPIRYNAKIHTDSGNYALTGGDLGLYASRVIIAPSGSYVLTGTSVTLRYSGDVTQTIGNVTANFTDSGISTAFKENSITVRFN